MPSAVLMSRACSVTGRSRLVMWAAACRIWRPIGIAACRQGLATAETRAGATAKRNGREGRHECLRGRLSPAPHGRGSLSLVGKQARSCRPLACWTIARICSRADPGRSAQFWTTSANSWYTDAAMRATAPDSAAPVSEDPVFPVDSGLCSCSSPSALLAHCSSRAM